MSDVSSKETRMTGEELLRRLTLSAKQTVDQIDLSLSLSGFYMVALKLYHSGMQQVKEDEIEPAYVNLMKFAGLCIDRLPKHRDYEKVKYREKVLELRRLADDEFLQVLQTLQDKILAKLEAQKQAEEMERQSLQDQLRRGEEARRLREQAYATKHEQKTRMKEEEELQKQRQEAESLQMADELLAPDDPHSGPEGGDDASKSLDTRNADGLPGPPSPLIKDDFLGLHDDDFDENANGSEEKDEEEEDSNGLDKDTKEKSTEYTQADSVLTLSEKSLSRRASAMRLTMPQSQERGKVDVKMAMPEPSPDLDEYDHDEEAYVEDDYDDEQHAGYDHDSYGEEEEHALSDGDLAENDYMDGFEQGDEPLIPSAMPSKRFDAQEKSPALPRALPAAAAAKTSSSIPIARVSSFKDSPVPPRSDPASTSRSASIIKEKTPAWPQIPSFAVDASPVPAPSRRASTEPRHTLMSATSGLSHPSSPRTIHLSSGRSHRLKVLPKAAHVATPSVSSPVSFSPVSFVAPTIPAAMPPVVKTPAVPPPPAKANTKEFKQFFFSDD